MMFLSTSLQGKIYFGILQVQLRQRGLNKYKRKVALLTFYNKTYKLILSARFKCPASNCVGPKLDTARKKSSVIVYFCSALSVWYSMKSNYQSLLSSRGYMEGHSGQKCNLIATCIPLDRIRIPLDRTFLPFDRTFIPLDRTFLPFPRINAALE